MWITIACNHGLSISRCEFVMRQRECIKTWTNIIKGEEEEVIESERERGGKPGQWRGFGAALVGLCCVYQMIYGAMVHEIKPRWFYQIFFSLNNDNIQAHVTLVSGASPEDKYFSNDNNSFYLSQTPVVSLHTLSHLPFAHASDSCSFAPNA